MLLRILDPTVPVIVYRTDAAFDLFDRDGFSCNGPRWQYDAGVALLVLYMVTMAILMLNLLIAVLSTVHDTVHERAELEFNLARNQFIQRGAGVVARGYLPPPFNVFMAIFSIIVDVLGVVFYTPTRNVIQMVCPSSAGTENGAATGASPRSPAICSTTASSSSDSRPSQEQGHEARAPSSCIGVRPAARSGVSEGDGDRAASLVGATR